MNNEGSSSAGVAADGLGTWGASVLEGGRSNRKMTIMVIAQQSPADSRGFEVVQQVY